MNEGSGEILDWGYPFQWVTSENETGTHQTEHNNQLVSTSELFPNLARRSMTMARVVGSSVQVVREDRTLDLSGTGTICRSYGTKATNTFKRNMNPTMVRQAVFRNEVSMKDKNALLYMNSCPVDYTDLDMVPIGQHNVAQNTDIFPRTPLIEGYITGLSGINAKFRFRFDVVIEYAPNMDLRSMVEVKNTVANTK